MTDLVRARLERIREREAAATEGPWTWGGRADQVVYQPLENKQYPQGRVRWCQSLTMEHQGQQEPDGQFIAASRTDVPALLALLDAAMAVADMIGVDFSAQRLADACNAYYAARKRFGKGGEV